SIALNMSKDDREFVSAQTRDHVRRSYVMTEPASDRAQHEIADPMTKRVVDLLEAIDVDEEKGRTGRVVDMRCKRLAKLILELMAIREPGEIVVVREVQQLGVAAIREC